MKKALFLLPGVIAVMFTAAPMISAFNNPALADDAPHAGKHHGEWDKLGLSDDTEVTNKANTSRWPSRKWMLS